MPKKKLSVTSANVYREGKTVVLEISGNASLANKDGVECVNPKDSAAKRIYRRVFRNPAKRIYLPNEYEQAVANHLSGPYVLSIAMNGYSSLTPEKCAEWGVAPGAYEKACRVLLGEICRNIGQRFPDADVRFLHGSSDFGVDRAISQAAHELRRPQLGFSCPEYLVYVQDNDVPIYIADSIPAYSDAFVRSGDILIAANGRIQAYEMDIAAVFKYHKFFLPINVLRLISTKGGPPAVGADGKVEDAVALFEQRVYAVGHQYFGPRKRDAWSASIQEAQDVVAHICRQVLDPEIGLEIHP